VVTFTHVDFAAEPNAVNRTELETEFGLGAESVDSITRYSLEGSTREFLSPLGGSVLWGDFETETVIEGFSASIKQSSGAELERSSYNGFDTLVGPAGTLGVNDSMVIIDASGPLETIVDTYQGEHPRIFDESEIITDVLSAAGNAAVTQVIVSENAETHAFASIEEITVTQAALAGDKGESSVLATHVDGGPDDAGISAIESELDVTHSETSDEIATFDVPADTSVNLTGTGGQQVVAPQVAFDVEESEETVTFTHTSGDTIESPKQQLRIAGPVQGSPEYDTSEGRLSAGGSITVTLADAAQQGDALRLVWSSPESDESAVLVEYTLAR
jgi:hypothetical protein